MKKKHIIGIIIGAFITIAVIIYVQIVMAYDENVTIHWEPLIYTGIVVGSVFVVNLLIFGVLSLTSIYQAKKLTAAFANKQYDKVIKLRNCNRLLKKASRGKDSVNYAVATAYLETGNNKMFLEYINKITNNDVINLKYVWMAIYTVLINDFEHFAYWQEQLKNSTSTEFQDTGLRTLNCLYKHKKNEYMLTEEDSSLIKNWRSDMLNKLFNLSC